MLRRDYVVRRRELNDAKFRLLVSLQGGATLQEAVGAAAAAGAESHEELARNLREWFEVWGREPLFAAAE